MQALTQLVYHIAVVQAAVTIGCSLPFDTDNPHASLHPDESDPASLLAGMAPYIMPFLRRAYILRCQVVNQPAIHLETQQPDTDSHHQLDSPQVSVLFAKAGRGWTRTTHCVILEVVLLTLVAMLALLS